MTYHSNKHIEVSKRSAYYREYARKRVLEDKESQKIKDDYILSKIKGYKTISEIEVIKNDILNFIKQTGRYERKDV